MATQESMEFNADASSVQDALRKMIVSNKELEGTLQAVQKQSQKGAELYLQAMREQNAATKKLTDENEKLREKLDEIKTANKETFAGEIVKGFARTLGENVLQALKDMAQAQSAYNKELAEAGRLADDLNNKTATQLGIKGTEYEPYRKQIYAAALNTSTTEQQAVATARSLGGEGISKEMATGAILQEVLTGAAATIADDPAALGKAVAGVLKAKGMDLNNIENVRSITTPIAAAWGAANLEAGDIPSLASVMSVSKDISPVEDIAAFATLRDAGQMEPSVAATNYRAIVTRMQTVKGDKTRYAALNKVAQSLGLNTDELAESFDFRGETFGQGMENFRSLVNSLDPETQSAFMKQMVGEEALAGLSTLVQQPDAFNNFMKISTDRSIMESNFRNRTSGTAAAARRQEVRRADELYDEQNIESRNEVFWKNLDTLLEEKGESAYVRQSRMGYLRFSYGGNAGTGQDAAQYMRDLDQTPFLRYAVPGDLVERAASLTEQQMGPGTMAQATVGSNIAATRPGFVQAGGRVNVNLRDLTEEKTDTPEETAIKAKELELRDLELKREQREAELTKDDGKFSKKDREAVDLEYGVLVKELRNLVEQMKIANDKKQLSPKTNANKGL